MTWIWLTKEEKKDTWQSEKALIKKQRDTVRVTLKRAGPDTEQLKEERLP